MKERPILFSTPMVKAILEGRKTQTRRIRFNAQVGDLLWVKETYARNGEYGYVYNNGSRYFFKATDEKLPKEIRWKPSIFMPREACRLFLRVVEVREEQLKEITEADAKAEGVNGTITNGEKVEYRINFAWLWNSLNAKRGYGWDTNPLVKVIEFKVEAI